MESEIAVERVAANVLSLRYFFRVTLLVMAEAGVWTQMSYLPEWLLKTTTVLAVLSFLALTFEPAIRTYSQRLARLTWLLYVSLAGVVVYGFAGNLQRPPFHATIRATTEYVGTKPFSLFMVAYQSPHGPTASPICYLMFLEFVNQQPFEITVDHYSVEVGRFRYIPLWHPLRPIL